MSEMPNSIAQRFLSSAMRAVVRYALRKGLRVQDVIDFAKDSFVELAAEELRQQGEKVTVSRLNVIT